MSKWLPSVLGSEGEAEPTNETDSEPAATEPSPPPANRQRSKQTFEPGPKPEPEPELTPEQQEAEDRWWKEVGDQAVAGFSRCLAEYVVEETGGGSQASYPDFVTAAMNSRCSREFATMAQLILERYGQDGFARIARKLIATKFVPAVKQVVEGGPPLEATPAAVEPSLEAETRRTKEAMLACLVAEADRLAASSAAAAEQVADRVIAACRTAAEAFFAKLEQRYPDATVGKAGTSEAILEASYRPAIVQRIAAIRGDGGAAGAGSAISSGGGNGITSALGGGKADAEATVHRRPAASPTEEAFSPAGAPAPASPVPASSQP